jgi:hypothetical protein
MAVSLATGAADIRLNKPWAGPYPLKHNAKLVFVRADFAGTYATGGIPVSLLLDRVGLKYADQVLQLSCYANDYGSGALPFKCGFDRETQKLILYREDVTAHPEYSNGVNVTTCDLDLMIVGR